MTKKKTPTLEDIRAMDNTRETQELINEHWDELAPQLMNDTGPSPADRDQESEA